MKIYLAISSGRGDAPRDVADIGPRLGSTVMATSAGPWRRETWVSRDRSTCLFAWSNEPEDQRLVPLLLTGEDAAVGCPGYLGKVADMDKLLRASDPGTVADELSGVFGVFRADQSGFRAVTTAVRLHPVYYASVGDVCVAGNRALLVHGAALRLTGSDRVRYDLSSIQSLVRSGYFLSDDSPFEGVRALRPHSTLEVRGGRGREKERPLPPPDDEAPTGRRRRELLDAFVDGLVAIAGPLRPFVEPVQLSITGGRDSRLVAAALHGARVPFRTHTAGLADHPDVVLGSRVAGLLGVGHVVYPPARDATGDALSVPHPLRRAWQVLRVTEGMISAHSSVAWPKPFTIAPSLSGAGGEQLRGGFLSNQTSADPDAMKRRVRDLFLPSEELMTDTANDRARAELAPWMERASRSPMEALDRIYLHYRTGRWSASGRAAAMASRTTFNVLFDNLLNRRALGMSASWRWSEEPFHQAIVRLAPALRNVPLTGKRWRYDVNMPGFFGRRAWEMREPLTVDQAGTGFDWRNQPSPSLLGHLREQILGGPEGLFELVRRTEMESLLARPLKKSAAVFVWNAFTASVLLSSTWLDKAPRLPEISIPLPAAHRRA